MDTVRSIFKLAPISSQEIDKYTHLITDRGTLVLAEGVEGREVSYLY